MTTAVGDVEMRIAKVVGLATDEEQSQCVVLEEVAGDRQLAMAARLGGIASRRPMTYQFVAALVQAMAGGSGRCGSIGWWRKTYLATVEVEGPPGMQSVHARPSDALNLAALVQAPIFAAPAVLQEAEARRAGDSPTAARLRRALAACPMTVGTVELSGSAALECGGGISIAS